LDIIIFLIAGDDRKRNSKRLKDEAAALEVGSGSLSLP
jgi:hypothetical protein